MSTQVTELLISAVFGLVSFGCALVFYDKYKKLEKLRKDDRQAAVDCMVQQGNELKAYKEMLTHWCNECIQLQRRLDREFIERRRWEVEAQSRLPRSYN